MCVDREAGSGCHRAEPPILLLSGATWLATASWEARQSRARLWGGAKSDLAVPEGDRGKKSFPSGKNILPVPREGPGGGGTESRLLPGLGGGEGDVPTSSCPSAAPSSLLTGLRRRMVIMNCRLLR